MKRFTETSKWTNPWFRQLSPKHKLLWLWIVDNCDAAGVINPDWGVASFVIGEAIGEKDIAAMNGNLQSMGEGRYFVPKFTAFQYGELNPACRPHQHVLKLLKSHGVSEGSFKGYPKGICTLKEQEQDKEQDKEQEKEPKDKTPSPIRLLTNAWMEAYKQIHGCPYVFCQAKDGAAASRLIKSGLSVGEIMDVATRAWRFHLTGDKKAYWSKQAAGLAGFSSRFNEIRFEVASIKGAKVDVEEARAAERAAKIEVDARAYYIDHANRGHEIAADGLRFLTAAQLAEQRRLFPDGPAAKAAVAAGGNGTAVATKEAA